MSKPNIRNMPVVKDLSEFDKQSGNILERLIFNYRQVVVAICLLATLVFVYLIQSRLELNASFEKIMPQSHPYIQNYLQNKDQLRGLGDSLRIVVENPKGTIFDAEYLETLRQINDEVFLVSGVDRAWMKSLWMPVVRWTEVTEEGFTGGPVIPESYDGSLASLSLVTQNVSRAGIAGSLVANDFRSSMIFVPMLAVDADGNRVDYKKLRTQLETIRAKYEKEGKVKIYIVGFSKLIGDLMAGLEKIMLYFLIAAIIAAIIILLYTKCLRSTALVLFCSFIAVLWQLGLIAALGFEIDPYSILVPFLVFAIGVSHGAQKMNGIMQDVGRGTHQLVAARYTFRRLFLVGLTALLADAVGFAVLMVIDIPVIRELALTASIGVAVLIFTNLILLPVLLSYTGVSPSAAEASLSVEEQEKTGKGLGRVWALLNKFTERKYATIAVSSAGVLTIVGLALSTQVKVGDLDAGAPELRPNSQYNLDNAYITQNYALSSDVFAVIVKTNPDGCMKYQTLVAADRLAWALEQQQGVQGTSSLVNAVRQITAGSYEGNPKWFAINRNQDVINYGAQQASTSWPDLFNFECSVMPVIAYLHDHKADTLSRVAATAEEFAKQNSTPDQQFLLAAGSAGIDAAINSVVKEANRQMLLYVYAAVIALCWLAFLSWRAVVVAVIPLMMTSILCEALMVILGIGIKVATLPVIALGVGIGVDYALYLLSLQLANQRRGEPLTQAYQSAVRFTGKVVALIGVTLAGGVVTWIFSPIKFQADMGILLTFMFILNMIGALVLIPALSHFLLPTEKVFKEETV
ncbi:MAG TPA: MMPL family transporter [Agitococcus sp.]|nr:MMPL family transporter [Agitococcus sp.]